jgi:hypothetical protein
MSRYFSTLFLPGLSDQSTPQQRETMKVTRVAPIVAALTLLVVDAGRVSSQTLATASDAQTRTQVIVASFNKFKHVTKEKYGIKREKYKKVQSEPVVKANPEDYSGIYEVPDLGFAMHLRVDHTGKVEGDGYEPLMQDPAVRRAFRLQNGKIEGALLTVTKVYAAGHTEKLEGVFINRASFESPTDKGFTTFGLGTVGRPMEVSGLTLDRLFYELKSQ